MADKQTTSYDLKFEWLFQDGDTRTFTMKNPKAEITTEEITALNTLILNEGNPLLIGDKAGANFRRINTVVRVTSTTTTLDLTPY